jgi:hypothetical protein
MGSDDAVVFGGVGHLNKTCEYIHGIFYYGITSESICDAKCAGENPTATLYGYVKNNSYPVSLANVTLTDYGISTLTTSESNPGESNPGYYIFTNIPLGEGDVKVKSSKGDCSWQGSIPFTKDTEYNISLSCCEYSCIDSGPCIDGYQNKTCTGDPELCSIPQLNKTVACEINLCKWNCTDWSPDPCPASGVQNRDCTEEITIGCQHQPPPLFNQNCQYLGSRCGNGVIAGSEQCDFNITTGIGNSTCPTPYNTSSWCNDDCTCKSPPIDVNCTNNPPSPQELFLNHVYNALMINASWDIPDKCYDYVKDYKIYGCDNQLGACNNPPSLYSNVSPELNKNTNNYEVLNTSAFLLIPNREYCFFLRTTFNSSIASGYITDSNVSCITLGDPDCYIPGSPTEWCGEYDGGSGNNVKGILNCGWNNSIVVRDCGEGFCTELDGVLDCMIPSSCDRCNALFGIFGYQGFQLYDNSETLDTLYCPTLSDKRAYLESSFAGCYLDYSTTSIDKTYNCAQVNSCYDYKSRDSCTSDYCNSFEYGVDGVNMCEWAEYGAVFNKGVCRPKEQYTGLSGMQQNCGLCSNPSYNRIYDTCTPDTCGLYGYCYFSKTQNKCLDGINLTCNDYDNSWDCTGGINTQTNTLWSKTSESGREVWQKAGGTNVILNTSNDTVGITRCYWNQTNCFKNADNLSESVGEAGKDCIIDRANKIRCERDVTPPTTTIQSRQTYGPKIDFSGYDTKTSLIVSDDNWPLADKIAIRTNNRNTTLLYYYFTSSLDLLNPAYPFVDSSKIETLTINPSSPDTNMIVKLTDDMAYHNTRWYFYYFAEDAAKNLERAKAFSFILDLMKPDISFTHTTNSYFNATTGNWSTNLFINIKLNSEISMPVVCFFNMTPKNHDTAYWSKYLKYNIPSPDTLPNNKITNSPGLLQTAYFGLESDSYYYDLSCIDDVGNEYHLNNTLRIEGDLTISNPYPDDEKYTQQDIPENISIETTAVGSCRYSMFTTNYSKMEGVYKRMHVGDKVDYIYVHYDSLRNAFSSLDSPPGIDPLAIPSGIYRIYTACNLTINGQNVIVNGDPTDTILFAVDDLPPKTRLYFDPTNGQSIKYVNFTNNFTTDILHLYLKNDDSNPLLTDINDMSKSFGPDRTFYCITDKSGSCTYEEYNLSADKPIQFDYNNTDFLNKYPSYPNFCYYSIDKGGNRESDGSGINKCMQLKLKNKNFQSPNITIIPLD